MTDNNDVVEGTETETSVMPGAEAHVQEDFAEADFGDDFVDTGSLLLFSLAGGGADVVRHE